MCFRARGRVWVPVLVSRVGQSPVPPGRDPCYQEPHSQHPIDQIQRIGFAQRRLWWVCWLWRRLGQWIAHRARRGISSGGETSSQVPPFWARVGKSERVSDIVNLVRKISKENSM